MTTRVAIDVGPLIGRATGIGRLTAALVGALEQREDIELTRYVLSYRAALAPGVVRLPLPARLALEAWSRSSWPSVERHLAFADVVHGTNYVVPPPRRPTVVSVHDATPFTMAAHVAPVVRRFPAVVRRAVAAGAWVHAISHHVADELSTLLATDRIVTVHPGALPAFAGEPGPLPPGVRTPYIVAIGTIEPRKNHVGLIEAFERVAGSLDDVQLVIAGATGPASDALAARVDRLAAGVRSRVVVTGWIDDACRATLLGRALAMAYPSLDEGFGFPMLEAMAAGVPVMAARAGAIGEVAGDAAMLADPTSPDDMAQALLTVCADTAHRQQLIAAGHRRVALFTWDNAASAMVELYGRAIAEW